MPEIILDKKLSAGTTYRCESDKYYVIEAIGTDSTTKPSYLEVDGKRCLEIYNVIAPLKRINTNRLGPLNLGKLYIVVPPNKTIVFHGSSGSKLRIIGKLGILGPGEVLGGIHQDRFKRQHINFVSYLFGQYEFAANTAVSAGTRQKTITWDCPVGENWKFNRLLAVEAWKSDDSAAGDLGFEIFIEGVPKDIIETTMGPKGFTPGSAPFPPRDTVNKEAFIPLDLALEFVPGKTLEVYATNEADLAAPGAGISWQFRTVLVGEKELTTIPVV